MNYKVGVDSKKRWRYLTDGKDVIEQIDFYHQNLSGATSGDDAPVKLLQLTQHQFDMLCKQEMLQIKIGSDRTWFNDYQNSEIKKEFNKLKQLYLDWIRIQSFYNYAESLKSNVEYDLSLNRWNRYHGLIHLSHMDKMTGIELEFAVKEIYEKNGYSTSLTQKSGDYGVDVIAYKGSEVLAIQTKRYAKPVGVRAIQEVASGYVYYRATKPLVVTNSTFTENAKTLAHTLGVELIDRKKLEKMWAEAFPPKDPPQFDLSEYNAKQDSISKLIGKPLHRWKINCLARLLAAKHLKKDVRVWVGEMHRLFDYDGFKWIVKIAVELGYISQQQIDDALNLNFESHTIQGTGSSYDYK